jgi:hypothetical protein
MLTLFFFFLLVKVPALAIGLCKFSGSAAQVKIVTSVAGIVLFLHNLLFVCVCLFVCVYRGDQVFKSGIIRLRNMEEFSIYII